MNRILKVARTQVLNRETFIYTPLIILVGAFLLSLVIFALIPTSEIKFAGGASFAPIWYYIAIGVYGLTLTFPFSQAMSVTRHEYYLGTLLVAALSAAGMAIFFAIGGVIEDATDGWGMNGWMFRIPGLWDAMGPWVSGIAYFTIIVLLFVIGFLCAVVYKRWGAMYLTIGLVTLGLLLIGAVFLITRLELWGSVGEVFVSLGATGATLVGLGFTILLAAVTYLPFRRTVA